MPTKKTPNAHNIFEKLHAIHKIIICLILSVVAYLLTDIKNINPLTRLMISWNVFSLCLLVLEWFTFKITTHAEIRKKASKEDSSRLVIFIIILISTCASFLAVVLLLISKDQSTQALDLPVAIIGMLFSWLLVHTIFTIRYAHIYYSDNKDKPSTHTGGLDFPGEDQPTYLDFAYFSFVLGMTFQVSDVQITSRRLRKLALLHGILSFGFNTVIVALTINVIAGLKK
ncbi:MAG: DUF1345 domain-containing protein [Ferruginibacter sp.]